MDSPLVGAVGTATYAEEVPGEEGTARVVVRFRLAYSTVLLAILDTGAPWNIVDPDIAAAHGLSPGKDDPRTTLSVRGERWEGRLVRAPMSIVADEGESLDLEGTFFVPDVGEHGWPYPNFLGYSGALQRLRFALLPDATRIAFGPTHR